MAKELTATQQAYALIVLYEKQYAKKYGEKPSLNRHRDKWNFQDMVQDLGYPIAQEIVEYYFELKYPGHPLKELFKNYDRFHEMREERREDLARRLALREQTRRRVEEFEKNNGNT